MSSSSYPRLETDRLILRQFSLKDAPRVETLAGDRAVAEMTLNIPYPYASGMAQDWISTHADDFFSGRSLVFALVTKHDHALIGAMGLIFQQRFHRAELGYWVGKPYWNRGYATEAAKAVVAYGFQTLKLNRIYATHMLRNPASGQVMRKLGMVQEGILRRHALKWDEYLDLAVYGLLRSEWQETKQV